MLEECISSLSSSEETQSQGPGYQLQILQLEWASLVWPKDIFERWDDLGESSCSGHAARRRGSAYDQDIFSFR